MPQVNIDLDSQEESLYCDLSGLCRAAAGPLKGTLDACLVASPVGPHPAARRVRSLRPPSVAAAAGPLDGTLNALLAAGPVGRRPASPASATSVWPRVPHEAEEGLHGGVGGP